MPRVGTQAPDRGTGRMPRAPRAQPRRAGHDASALARVRRPAPHRSASRPTTPIGLGAHAARRRGT
eukprot:5112705-Lingulodinium_polyedra.AAC.1